MWRVILLVGLLAMTLVPLSGSALSADGANNPYVHDIVDLWTVIDQAYDTPEDQKAFDAAVRHFLEARSDNGLALIALIDAGFACASSNNRLWSKRNVEIYDCFMLLQSSVGPNGGRRLANPMDFSVQLQLDPQHRVKGVETGIQRPTNLP